MDSQFTNANFDDSSALSNEALLVIIRICQCTAPGTVRVYHISGDEKRPFSFGPILW
jgi:hypothetical protein